MESMISQVNMLTMSTVTEGCQGSPGVGSCRTPYWADYGNPDGGWGGDYRFYQDAFLRYNTGLVSTSTMHRLFVGYCNANNYQYDYQLWGIDSVGGRWANYTNPWFSPAHVGIMLSYRLSLFKYVFPTWL